jgi:hypothetical protein
VKHQSPAEVTLYAGYTNGMVSYFPTAAEYPFGGYEPGYSDRSFGLPAQVAPECEDILLSTGARLVASLFPDGAPHGETLQVPAPDRYEYPSPTYVTGRPSRRIGLAPPPGAKGSDGVCRKATENAPS